MFDLHAGLCALPVELKELILSKIEHIEAHHILVLSSTFQEAFSLLRALPRTFDYEGVEGVLADHLVRLLDDDRVRSLGKERALQLIGDGNKDRLCQYVRGSQVGPQRARPSVGAVSRWARERRVPRVARAT